MNFDLKKRIFFFAIAIATGFCALPSSAFCQHSPTRPPQSPSHLRQTNSTKSTSDTWGGKLINPFAAVKNIAQPKAEKAGKSRRPVATQRPGNSKNVPISQEAFVTRIRDRQKNLTQSSHAKNNRVSKFATVKTATSSFTPSAKTKSFRPQISQPIPLQNNTPLIPKRTPNQIVNQNPFGTLRYPQPRQNTLPAGRSIQSVQQVNAALLQPNLSVPPPTDSVPPVYSEPQATPPNSNSSIQVPLVETEISENIHYKNRNGKVWLVVRDEPITAVLGMIAQANGLNIVASSEVTGQVTVTLTDVDLEDALSAILVVNGYTWSLKNNILLISQLNSETQSSALAQGRQVQVFPLNYVSAIEVDKVIKGLLSPVGNSFVSETDPQNKLKTREQIVVEDLPEYLQRIHQYILEIDHPPQQVYIEAHILQGTLSDDDRHGVNFNQFFQLANTELQLQTRGFANSLASPSFSLGLNTPDLEMLIEWLQTTTDAKTLASPKVSVVNGQEAKIQVGEQLGYLVTTTTQTSTLQEVNFLDLGVVLRVTPQISNNNQVLMTVKPEVSSGRINPDTGLPEEDTTEVETTILLSSGQGMVIGGLIKETDFDSQSKVPFLGDIWVAGKLFQKHTLTRERHEIIIALIPKIMPCNWDCNCDNNTKLQQATTPLFYGPLHRVERPWEPRLPSPIDNPRYYRSCCGLPYYSKLTDEYPKRPEYYFPTVYENRMEHGQGYPMSTPSYQGSQYPSYRVSPGTSSPTVIPDAPPPPDSAMHKPFQLIQPKVR